MFLYKCLSICACVSLWYAKYIWHLYQMSQKVQNVKMVSVCVCVLVFLACMSNEAKSAKCDFLKIRNFKNIIDRCIISSL